MHPQASPPYLLVRRRQQGKCNTILGQNVNSSQIRENHVIDKPYASIRTLILWIVTWRG